MDNEAERQKYEILQQSQRDMCEQLGSERLTAVVGVPKHMDAPINEIRRMDHPRGRLGGPRPHNLEQLYHETLPMNKALSHSGPSAFGNGLIVSFVAQHHNFYFLIHPGTEVYT